MNTQWAALDGKLIEWHPQENEQYTVLDSDLFELWRREQERRDDPDAE